MTKKQDSGLSCFMIVMKFHGIPITKEQAENLAVFDSEQKVGENEIIQSTMALKMKAIGYKMLYTHYMHVGS